MTSVVRTFILAGTLAACGGDSAPANDMPCAGNASGGFSLTDRADMTYSVRFSEDSVRGEQVSIRALFVGRGASGWQGKSRGVSAPPSPLDTMSSVSGASLGSLYLGYDERTRTAWIHDQPVPLDSFNVVLVDRVDSVGGPPVVAHRLRVAPDIRLGDGVCRQRGTMSGSGFVDSLRAVMLRHPVVREFAAGR